jgi:hypothetical protein
MLTSGNFLPRVLSISILLQRHSQTLTVWSTLPVTT